ncbi:hypothetical protein [uncultured Pontibacter sp.]|uniref:hypothetical protein n=1 Tax=uncultured Pontibacter sp. TaxID=453356 RepID=UPI00260D59CB|nr:hypothetical protein [uncultured Pontibacter sp.]
MRNDEQNFDRDYRNRSQRSGHRDNLSNYQSRYEDKGNYYGMPDQGHEYRNVSSRNQDERRTQGRMHQNEWGGNADYNRGSQSSSQDDHYRYGDPNPYMNYQRQGGYERERGTGWRSEGVDHGNRRYERQENSYRQTGHGRRFDQYGRDEEYNYAHGRQDGRRSVDDPESLDDRYYDRGEHSRSSSENDYGRQYGSNYDHRNRDRQGRNDNYESRSYRDKSEFDRRSDESPSRSPRGYGYRSGPDYSASSPITNYGPGVRGYQK